MTRLALRLDVDGTVTDLDLDAPEGSYQVLRNGVGNWIEPLDFGAFYTYVDEEGLYSGAKFNPYATTLLRVALGTQTVPINGPMVFVGAPNPEGDTTGLTDLEATAIRSFIPTLSDLDAYRHLFREGYSEDYTPTVTVTSW